MRRRQARLLVEQGRYHGAYARYQRILQVYPRDGQALLSAGLVAVQAANAAIEHDHPGAAATVRRSPDEALAAPPCIDVTGSGPSALARLRQGLSRPAISSRLPRGL